MKVALIRPPQLCLNKGFPVGPRAGLPIGLLSIAAVLEKGGHQVKVIDALLDIDVKTKTEVGQGEWVHFGMSWERLREKVSSFDPDIIGIGNQFTTNLDMSLKTARLLKDTCPRAIVVIGGPHASSAPEDVLQPELGVDIACIGEGEHVLLDLAGQDSAKIKFDNIEGIAYLRKNQLTINKLRPPIANLDSLPLPAYHLVDMERYFYLEKERYVSRATYRYPGSERTASIITSRGCPFNCVFCGIQPVMGRRWRAYSPDYIISHLQYLADYYRIRHIHFEDDNLTLSRRRFFNLIQKMIDARLGITWDTPNGVRADRLDERLLRLIKQSGCTYLVIGVESGDQMILDRVIGKKLDLKQVERTASLCVENGLDLHAFYIIGLPGENMSNIKKTLSFALKMKRRYNIYPHLNLAYPLIGSRLRRICIDRGYLTTSNLPQTYRLIRGDKYKRQMIETEEFKLTDLYRASKNFHRLLIGFTVARLVRFLTRHPRVLISLIGGFSWRYLLNPHALLSWTRQIFSEKLLFENCLLRKFDAQSGRQLVSAGLTEQIITNESVVSKKSAFR